MFPMKLAASSGHVTESVKRLKGNFFELRKFEKFDLQSGWRSFCKLHGIGAGSEKICAFVNEWRDGVIFFSE